MFLFTSCSLRFAAWAGWYSAFGDREKTEQFIHQAHTEWVKELGAARRFDFFDRHNSDMWKYIPTETMKKMVEGIPAHIAEGFGKRRSDKDMAEIWQKSSLTKGLRQLLLVRKSMKNPVNT